MPNAYDPNNNTGRTLAGLIYQRGQQQAAYLLDRGQSQARAWQQAGGAISGAVDSWRASVENNRRLALEQAREADRQQTNAMQRESAQLTLDEQKHQAKGRKAMRDVLPLAQRQDGVVGYDRTVIQRELEAAGQADLVPQVFQQLDEQDAAHFKVLEARRDAVAGDAFRLLQSGGDERAYNSMIARWEANDSIPVAELDAMREAGKTPEQRQRALLAAVNSSPTFAEQVRKMQTANAPKLMERDPAKELIDERTGELLSPATATAKTPTSYEAAILAETDPAKRQQLITERQQYAAAGRAPAAPPAPEPLVAITGPDGKPVFVPRSQAVGQAPANTREQGRQVTSGDAGDIAELNTALDDLSTLKTELTSNGATGTSAQALASLWTPITNLTGWGVEAKQKQAQIDRVKQVIGKALEGGVLRKEDEAKYEKILPTIKDSPAVVTSKLNGLVSAIEKKHGRKLDALSSAGYDVSRFAPAGAGGPVKMTTPDGRSITVPADKVEEAKARGAKVVG